MLHSSVCVCVRVCVCACVRVCVCVCVCMYVCVWWGHIQQPSTRSTCSRQLSPHSPPTPMHARELTHTHIHRHTGPYGRRGDQVGGFTLMLKDDLRRMAPLWLKYTEEVRADPDVGVGSGP